MMEQKTIKILVSLVLGAALLAAAAGSQGIPPAQVIWELKTNDTDIRNAPGNFPGGLSDNELFGQSVVSLGDLDGDGFSDVAVGAPGDAGGGTTRGAVWILFLDINRKVKSWHKISALSGDLPPGSIQNLDEFGSSVTTMGDFDGDGVTDLVVGAPGALQASGAVWLLYLNTNGSVKASKVWSINTPLYLFPGDRFGQSVASLGDLNNDGTPDLAVGLAGRLYGNVWLFFLRPGATNKQIHPIYAWPYMNDPYSLFGTSLAYWKDLHGSNFLAVGAPRWDGTVPGSDRGGVVIYELFVDSTDPNNPVVTETGCLVDDSHHELSGKIDDGVMFGSALAALGNLNKENIDEYMDLAVSAPRDNDGGSGRGSVWILYLDPFEPYYADKISSTSGGFDGPLVDSDFFGIGLATLQSAVPGAEVVDIICGTWSSDGGPSRGATWSLRLFKCSGMARFRNDPGNVNLPNFSTWEYPILAQDWHMQVDNTGTGCDTATVVGFATPLCWFFQPVNGFILVNFADVQVFQFSKTGTGVVTFSEYVPDDPALAGIMFSAQAYGSGPGVIKLYNALDVVVGID